jgi:hypothetical protein
MTQQGCQNSSDKPIERSARTPPPRLSAASWKPGTRPATAVDPRFDSLHGSLDPNKFGEQYKFLREMEEKEQQARLVRIRLVSLCLRRRRMERLLGIKKMRSVVDAKRKRPRHIEDLSDEKGGDDEPGYSLEELEEIVAGLSDEEEEIVVSGSSRNQHVVDATSHTDEAIRERRHMIDELRHQPLDALLRELDELKHQSTVFKSKTSNTKALSRQSGVRKELLKKELQSVKEGKKKRVFAPKRSTMKEQVLEKTYDSLKERGGLQMVSTYLERKAKRQR